MADWDITQLNSLEHDTTQGRYNSLVQIDDTHFILAYTGADDDGYIKTFSVNLTTGAWTEIDVLEHDSSQAKHNSLVKISATYYALAYQGVDSDGFLKTFSIDGNYDNITVIDSLEFDTIQNSYNSLVVIDSTHLINAYQMLSVDGNIITFSIDASADNITALNSLEYDTADSAKNSLVKIDATHFAVAYTGTNGHGFIQTLSIDGSYAISSIDKVEHDTDNSYDPSLVLVNSSKLILADNMTGTVAVKTLSFDGSYDNITTIDTLEAAHIAAKMCMVKISDTHYAIASAENTNTVGSDGHITIVSIDANADNITQVSTLEHDTGQGTENSLVYSDGKLFLAYAGEDSANPSTGQVFDGFVKTFSVWQGSPAYTLPTRNSYNRFYVFRNIPTRWS